MNLQEIFPIADRMFILVFVIGFLVLATDIYITLKGIKMTQQEAHDQLANKIEELKTAINAASTRVAQAIVEASGKQAIDNTDLLNSLDAGISTVNAIAPAPVSTENNP